MANTNLAGEKSDVKIGHASIASGNLSMMFPSNKKTILGKKRSRPNGEKQNNSVIPDKKPVVEDKELPKSDKSNFSNLNNYLEKSEHKSEQKDKKSENKVIKPKAVYKESVNKEIEKEKKKHVKVESENSDEEEGDENEASEDSY